MKKDEIIGFVINFYDRQEVHNIPTLVDNVSKDGFVLKYDEDKSEIVTLELGKALIDFLNYDARDKQELMRSLLANYSLLAFKSIYELKTKKTFKDEYKNKKEYEEFVDEVLESCYEDIVEAQRFFKDYINKIYNYEEVEKYNESDREMRELLFLKDGDTNLKLYNKYEKYIQANLSVGITGVSIKIWPFIKTEKTSYVIGADNIIAILYAMLKYYTRYKSFNINKCEYCSDYFMPMSRSDEKFCSKVYADGTTCRKLGVRDNWKTIQDEDNVRKLYTNTYQKKLMYCKRNPEDEQAKEDFEIWKVNVKTIMKLYKKGSLKKDDVIIYIESGNLDNLRNKEN